MTSTVANRSVAAEKNPFVGSRLAGLDALRFFAMLQVAVYHAGWDPRIGEGVVCFFTLSGFLFSWIFLREYARTGRISISGFYLRRSIRILPAFYGCVIITVLGKVLLHKPCDWGHAISSILFSANYYNAWFAHPPTGFSCFWTLAVEEQFYLIWPWVFLLCMRQGPSSMPRILAGTAVCVAIWRGLLVKFGASEAYLYNAFDTRCDALAFGCLSGWAVTQPWFWPRFRRLLRSAWVPVAIAVALFANERMPNLIYQSAGRTFEAALFALLILCCVAQSQGSYRWLEWQPLVWGGRLSYSAYLYHAWGLGVGRTLAAKLCGSLAVTNSHVVFGCELLLGIAATMILGAISYFAIERPCLLWRDREKSKQIGSPLKPPVSSAPQEQAMNV